MTRPKNSEDQLARAAADRIDRAQARGKQLAMFTDEHGEPVGQVDRPAGPGRVKGSKNRNHSRLKDWLTARGLSLPEDRLVAIAGLDSDLDPFTRAQAQAELLLAWAGDGARRQTWDGSRHVAVEFEATADERIDAFKFFYGTELRAGEAMMPYVHARITPDAGKVIPVPIFMPAAPQAPADPAAGARDITPPQVRMAPPPQRWKRQPNQPVENSGSENSDG